MEQQTPDDIVKKIIRAHEVLKPDYYESLDTLTDSNVELPNLGTKLHS